MSDGYALCPTCRQPMYVESVHNGVMYVWHGVHCGWGQDGFAPEDVFRTIEEARKAAAVADAVSLAKHFIDGMRDEG